MSLLPVGRQKFVSDVLNAAPVACTRAEEAKSNILHFYRPAAATHIPERRTPPSTNHLQGSLSCQNLKKRHRPSKNGDGPHPSPPKKRSPTLTAEDVDLLSQYWHLSPAIFEESGVNRLKTMISETLTRTLKGLVRAFCSTLLNKVL